MSKWFFNYDSGDMGFATSDSMGMSSDGDMLMRMGDNMVMNLDTGDLEMISGWPEDDSRRNPFDDDEE